MKCPYRKQTTNILNEIFGFYMDCYEDECPFWGAIGIMYNVDNGLFQETETGCRRAKKERQIGVRYFGRVEIVTNVWSNLRGDWKKDDDNVAEGHKG